MLIEDNEKSHYVAIKSLGRLLSMQNSNHKESQHFCTNCLQGFAEQHSRDEHYAYCRSNKSVRIEMPTKHPIVEYSNRQHQFKVPFVMYTDFEFILEPIQGAINNPNVSSARGVNVHTPSGRAYIPSLHMEMWTTHSPNIEVQIVLRGFVNT